MTVQERLEVPVRANLCVADYLLLCESGALDRYNRTELIEGEIWVMNSIMTLHARTQTWLSYLLQSALLEARLPLVLYTAASTELSNETMPVLDLVIGEAQDRGVLVAAKARLVIEVSDTTLSRDLGLKVRLFATAAIPEYWVVDVNARVIQQFWSPAGETYAERRGIAFGRIASVTMPELAIDTAQL